MTKHFLNIKDIEIGELRKILSHASDLKIQRLNKPKGFKDMKQLLRNFVVALIFEKPSTRTRFSFDVGIRQMGGETITVSKSEIHLGKNENIADTARVLSKYVDLVIIRTFDQRGLLEFAEYSSVPVINGLTNQSHPCQVLADVFTYEECRNSIKGKKVTWAGDGNNVCNSYLEAAAKFGFKFCFFGPENYRPDPKLISEMENSGGDIVSTVNSKVAFHEADLVVTDTWLSMHEQKNSEKVKTFQVFQVNSKKMKLAKKDTIVLHCLPAHRGYEITNAVIDGESSRVFDAAENRLHVQKAIMSWVLDL